MLTAKNNAALKSAHYSLSPLSALCEAMHLGVIEKMTARILFEKILSAEILTVFLQQSDNTTTLLFAQPIIMNRSNATYHLDGNNVVVTSSQVSIETSSTAFSKDTLYFELYVDVTINLKLYRNGLCIKQYQCNAPIKIDTNTNSINNNQAAPAEPVTPPKSEPSTPVINSIIEPLPPTIFLINRSNIMPHLSELQKTIFRQVIKLFIADKLIPDLPANYPLFPENFSLSNADKLNLNELQLLLDYLHDTCPSYQETATRLQCSSSKIFPINFPSIVDASEKKVDALEPSIHDENEIALVYDLISAIERPSLYAVQRKNIKDSINEILKGELIQSDQNSNLEKLLCTVKVQNNVLTQENLQQFLDVFTEKWRRLTTKKEAIFPIPLSIEVANTSPQSLLTLKERILNAINPIGLKYSQRIEMGISLLNACDVIYSDIPSQKLITFEKELTFIIPENNGELSSAQQKQLTKLISVSAENTNIQKSGKLVELHDFRFWSCYCTKQKLIDYNGDAERKSDIESLIKSRNYYINLRDTCRQIVVYDGFVIGTLTTLLTAVAQNSSEDSKTRKNIDWLLLIVPILLGLFTSLGKNISDYAQEKIDVIDKNLLAMNIDLEIGVANIDNDQPPAARI